MQIAIDELSVAIARDLRLWTDPDALWDKEQVAEYLGVSPRTVEAMNLPNGVFSGKRKRWVAKEIKAWAKKHR